MPTPKLQVSRAIQVITSNDANIPYPAVSMTGTSTSAASYQLVDINTNFNTFGISAGDIVYNYAGNLAAIVISVIDNHTLKLNADIIPAMGVDYKIFLGTNNDGCVLYVGTSGNLKVTTAGGDVVTFNNMPVGFLPVQVVKVWASGTSAAQINGLF